MREDLTFAANDLAATSVGVEGSMMLHPRLQVSLSFEGSRASAATTSRFPRPGGGGAPMRQVTDLTVEPLGAVSGRFYLVPPFEYDNASGWVGTPSAVFVGAGSGMLAYRFRQSGEFYDAQRSIPFVADLRTEGRGRLAFASAGFEVPLWARLGLLLETRYLWASAPMAGDYVAFDPIDLSGFRFSAGLQRRW